MAPTAFIRNSLLGAFVLLAIAGSIDYAVDPFQQYRVPTFYTPRFYHAYQRHENPGIARHYVYNRAVVGSSFFENISGSEVDRAFGPGHRRPGVAADPQWRGTRQHDRHAVPVQARPHPARGDRR